MRQERIFQVLDIYSLGPKTFASVHCLKPHIGGFLCTKRVIVIQVYNYTHTPQDKREQPFQVPLCSAELCVEQPADLLLLAA